VHEDAARVGAVKEREVMIEKRIPANRQLADASGAEQRRRVADAMSELNKPITGPLEN